jgi:phage gp36-like protein
MSYIAQSDIEGLIPAEFLVQALDDNGDGQPDAGVWDKVALIVQEAIDGAVGAVYRVPFAAPLPSIIQACARALACDTLYKRRGIADALNPWAKPAADARAALKRLADGDDFLPGLTRTSPAPVLISEPAKTTSASGRLMS